VAQDRKLVVDETEDATVQTIFNEFLRLGNPMAGRQLVPLYQQAVERAAEQQRLANRPVRELTDEELTALILAEHPELDNPTPDGADAHLLLLADRAALTIACDRSFQRCPERCEQREAHGAAAARGWADDGRGNRGHVLHRHGGDAHQFHRALHLPAKCFS